MYRRGAFRQTGGQEGLEDVREDVCVCGVVQKGGGGRNVEGESEEEKKQVEPANRERENN
jgi:hypothetical protein